MLILRAVSDPLFSSLKEVMTRSPLVGSFGQVNASVIWSMVLPSFTETMVLRWIVFRLLCMCMVMGISTQSFGFTCSVGVTRMLMVSDEVPGIVIVVGSMVVCHLMCGLGVCVVILKVCAFLEWFRMLMVNFAWSLGSISCMGSGQ